MSWQEKFGAQGAGSGHAKVQYGALCWREGSEGIEVLLITSRNTGRWVIPKGWPMPGLAPEAAAAQEAWEEAGVDGRISPLCLGRFGYQKLLGADASVPCAVAVYGMKVFRLADSFPEAKERRRQWFPAAEAAALVNEPELARIIAGFTPPEDGRPAPIAAEEGADWGPKRKRDGRRRH
ncbi:NUDIX hydrolase [Rhodobacter calidifons]|uniref:NUDIX hydrolase n=1 Tax=Rhodobacter calidifons TaxID=2715277 RepID=A0ABX0G1Q4_9RHOB|nr:NUDIX hydrolase [Rhodobacter calidifons]NHB75206.1 NUDIX hydrolase [Rhodobacter calidifons]